MEQQPQQPQEQKRQQVQQLLGETNTGAPYQNSHLTSVIMNLFHNQPHQPQQPGHQAPQQPLQGQRVPQQLSSTVSTQSPVAIQAEQQQQQQQSQYPPQQNQFQPQQQNQTNTNHQPVLQQTQQFPGNAPNPFNPLVAAMQNPNIMALLSRQATMVGTNSPNAAQAGGLQQLLALMTQQQQTPSQLDSHINAASHLLASNPDAAGVDAVVAAPAAVASSQAAHPNPAITSTKAPAHASLSTGTEHVLVGPSGGGKGSRSVIPCRARGMPMNHNFNTAYFIIEEGIAHGAQLVCTYPTCRNGGSKFRWCHSCKAPVAKRNFKNRHSHSEELGLAASGNTNVEAPVDATLMSNTDHTGHSSNVQSVHATAAVAVNSSNAPTGSRVKEARKNRRDGVDQQQQQRHNGHRVANQHQANVDRSQHNDRRSADGPNVVQLRRSRATPTPRQHAWASLLDDRPMIDEGDQVSAWLMRVLSVSDPDIVPPRGPFVIPDGSVSGGTHSDARNGQRTSESTQKASGQQNREQQSESNSSSDRSPSGDSCGTDVCSSTESLSPSTSGRSDESANDSSEDGKINGDQLPDSGRGAEGIHEENSSKRKKAHQGGATKKQKRTD